MKKVYLFFIALILAFAPRDTYGAEDISFERQVLATTMISCLNPVVTNHDVAAAAVLKKLPEFPEKQAKILAPHGGRVFALPVKENAVLIAPPIGGCQIMIRQIDPLLFWREEDRFFGDTSPFKKIEESKTADDMTRRYVWDFHGPVGLWVSAHNQMKEGQPQAVITIARYKN